MSTNKNLWISLAALLVIIGGVWYFLRTPASSFAVSREDQPISWSLPLPQDAASSTPRLTAQIAQLSKIVGQGQYPDSDIYTAIGNDYAQIGDGKNAYKYYLKAADASSTYALAYDNMGALFARLHATSTATRAYAKAVGLNPDVLLYQLSYLDYLAETKPNDAGTATAFASAKQRPRAAENTSLLIAEAGWLEQIGSTTAAIADWRKVLTQEPGNATAINARIQLLLKK